MSSDFEVQVIETLYRYRNNICGNPLAEAREGIMFVIKDLIEGAGLSSEIVDRYREFGGDEDLLYFHKAYRDHFFHPFHTFLLGFIILSHLKSSEAYEYTCLDHDKFLKKWLLTSLWHDITYTAEKGPYWLSGFIKERMNFDIQVDQNWSTILWNIENRCAIEDIVQKFIEQKCSSDKIQKTNESIRMELEKFYQSWLFRVILSNSDNRKDISMYGQFITEKYSLIKEPHYVLLKRKENLKESFKSWLIRQLFKYHDHGVLSALLLLKEKDIINEALKSNKENWTYDDFKEVALSIALHNYSKSLTSDNKKVKNGDMEKKDSPSYNIKSLNIEQHFLAFLLTLCDNAQEWGRSSSKRPTEHISYYGVDKDYKTKGLSIKLHFDFEKYLKTKNKNSEVSDSIKCASEVVESYQNEKKKIKSLLQTWKGIKFDIKILTNCDNFK